jgi:hypothetical protein
MSRYLRSDLKNLITECVSIHRNLFCPLAHSNKLAPRPVVDVAVKNVPMRCFFVHIKRGDRIENAGSFQLPDLSYAQINALLDLTAKLTKSVEMEAEPIGDVMLILDEMGHELASVPLGQALQTRFRRSGN